MPEIEIRSEVQKNPIADEVSALIAVVRPILNGLLWGLKQEIVNEIGTYESISLKLLPRLIRQGDGDCGICYEYAVHDAIQRREASVLERMRDAAKLCKVPGSNIESILFGIEKRGMSQLIATADATLTDDSRLLTGKPSTYKLRRYLNVLVGAFRRKNTRLSLPSSINGLWKADLFLGTTDGDRWVGTTVKINSEQLVPANGLRIGVVPARHGATDRVVKDESKNLVICPIPYDGAFMEVFYHGWGIVQQFIHADAKMPKEVSLPTSCHRQVAHELVSRRDFTVVDVIDALLPLAQPQLLQTNTVMKPFSPRESSDLLIGNLISPTPLAK